MRRVILVPLAALVFAAGACSATGSVSTNTASTNTVPANTGASQQSSAAADVPAKSAAASPTTAAAAAPAAAKAGIGAGTHMVTLKAYDDAKHTAVIVSGGSEYTLPVDPSFRVFSTNGGNPSCMNGTGTNISGSCMAGTDWLIDQLKHNVNGFQVEIANTADYIYEISERYQP